jgi:putative transposase
MLAVLEDAPRSGAPVRISMAQKQQITALACRKPQDYGIPVTQWNREMLAQVAVAQGIVETISPRYISELLKNQRTTTAQIRLLAQSED